MSDAPSSAPRLVTELKVSAHLMQLDPGVYCVYHSPGSAPPDPATGLPGARLSVPPAVSANAVSIVGFQQDGWLGPADAAALIRISSGPAAVLVTIYQDGNSQHEAPRLQVTKVVEGAQAAGVAPVVPGIPAAAPSPPPQDAEVAAHLQQRGDTLGRLGDWMGERGSTHWIEGFALAPHHPQVSPADIEYQAVLGRGWLSPWAEGGQFCGSRGMALPILGLRVRLRGKATETHTVQVDATFTDGTAIGPVGSGEPCEAESLAPLEAFCVTVVPNGLAAQAEGGPAQPAAGRRTRPRRA